MIDLTDTPEINIQHEDMLKFYKGVLLQTETNSYIQAMKKFKNHDPIRILDVGGGVGKIGFLLQYDEDFRFEPDIDFEYHNIDLNPTQLEKSPGHKYLDDRMDINKIFKEKKFPRIFYLFPTQGYKLTDSGEIDNVDVSPYCEEENVLRTYMLPIFKMMLQLQNNGLLTVAHFEYVDLLELFKGIDHPDSGLEVLPVIRGKLPETVYSKTSPDMYLPKVNIFRLKKVKNKDNITREKISSLERQLGLQ